MSTSTSACMASVDGAEPVAAQIQIRRNDRVEWTNQPKPDPKWQYVDAAGHFHAYDHDGRSTPTLVDRHEHRECDGSCGGVCDGEGYDIVHSFCAICDEEIQPGMTPGPHSFMIEGLMDWEIVVETPLTKPGKVSIVVTAGQWELFGIAEPHRIDAGSDGGRTWLRGVSELGRRQRGTEAVA